MNSNEILEQLKRREHAAVLATYDAYGISLLDYGLILTGDADHATNAVHDALVAAGQHAGNVRKHTQLRPWLFALVRNNALRVSSSTAPLAGAVAPAEQPRPRQIVEAAVEGLSRKFREPLYLSIRYEFGTREIARITGGSKLFGKSRVAQAKAHLADAVAGGQLLSLGSSECAVMAGMFERETVAVRTLAAHRRRCATCYQTTLPPLNLLAVLAALPMVQPPSHLRERIAADINDPVSVERIAAMAKPFAFNGFPASIDNPPNTKRRLALATAALVTIGGVALWSMSPGQANKPDSTSEKDRTSLTKERRATASPTASPTPTSTSTPSPTPTKQSNPRPRPTASQFTPTPTEQPVPEPTPTEPSPTPTPTPTPRPTLGR